MNEYRSKFEMRIADDMMRRGIAFEYEKELLQYYKKKPMAVCQDCGSGEVLEEHWYNPDFYLPKQGIYIEAKGKFTPKDRSKMLAVMEYHLDKDIRMLFMYDNWMTKKKLKKYGGWCDDNAIQWAVGDSVPEEWVK